MKNAPHLPPRSCSVPAYYLRQSAPWVVIIILLSLLSGVAAALTITAWGIPEGNIASFSDRILLRRTVSAEVLDQTIVRHVSMRMVEFYDMTKKSREQTFGPEARLGEGLLLSSDGWAVLFLKTPPKAKDLVAIDSQGVSYLVGEVVQDKVTSLTYVHLIGNGFRVAAFGDVFRASQDAWTISSREESRMVQVIPPRFIQEKERAFTLGQPALLPRVHQLIAAGSIVTDDRGEVLGMVGETQTLFPAWLLERHVRQVIGARELSYPDFGIEGTLVEVVEEEGMFTRLPGLMVTKITPRAREAGMMLGDRIDRVNGVPVSFDSLSREAMNDSELRLTVRRNGEDTEVLLTALP
jgi:hypothetical protein